MTRELLRAIGLGMLAGFVATTVILSFLTGIVVAFFGVPEYGFFPEDWSLLSFAIHYAFIVVLVGSVFALGFHWRKT